jgi:Mn-dependent DtxR family transcriptional regulator
MIPHISFYVNVDMSLEEIKRLNDRKRYASLSELGRKLKISRTLDARVSKATLGAGMFL